MSQSPSEALAEACEHGFIEAPAGFGKTETIADALSLCKSKQLVLTHTHAGVDSLRKRIKAKKISSKLFHLETIDSFSLKLAKGYPRTSQYKDKDDGSVDWKLAREGASKVLAVPALKQHFSALYGGAIVDEYQDCSYSQHSVVCALSQMMTVRILGDPLQRLFTFDKEDPCILWEKEVLPIFTKIATLDVPHRWNIDGANKALGEWLIGARTKVSNGEAPDYSAENCPAAIKEVSPSTEIFNIVKDNQPRRGEKMVVLVPQKAQMRNVALKLSRLGFSCMEEIEAKALLEFCRIAAECEGPALAAHVIEFVGNCTTAPTQKVDTILRHLKSGTLSKLKPCQPANLAKYLMDSGGSFKLENCTTLINMVEKQSGRRIIQKELLKALKQTLKLHSEAAEADLALIESARKVRMKISHVGRQEEFRIVSRPLLVKGLQYDHVLIVDPHTFTKEELYVALTRGVKSVTVVGLDLVGVKASKAETKVTKPAARLEDPNLSLFGDEDL